MKHYNNQSKPYLKSLDFLEIHMRENKTLSGKNSTQVEDIFIASLILEKGLNASFQDFWCAKINNHLIFFEKRLTRI